MYFFSYAIILFFYWDNTFWHFIVILPSSNYLEGERGARDDGTIAVNAEIFTRIINEKFDYIHLFSRISWYFFRRMNNKVSDYSILARYNIAKGPHNFSETSFHRIVVLPKSNVAESLFCRNKKLPKVI